MKNRAAMRFVDKWDFNKLMAEYQLVMTKKSPHTKAVREIIEMKVLLMAEQNIKKDENNTKNLAKFVPGTIDRVL